jgi:hypothetical protein
MSLEIVNILSQITFFLIKKLVEFLLLKKNVFFKANLKILKNSTKEN